MDVETGFRYRLLVDHTVEGRMFRTAVARLLPPFRVTATLTLLASALLTSGFSSCAGGTGPLFAPLSITPQEILLRSSLAAGQEAVGLARVESGEPGERFGATVEYVKDPGVDWLSVQVVGRNLTLRARPGGLGSSVYRARVIVEASPSGASGSIDVEFIVTP